MQYLVCNKCCSVYKVQSKEDMDQFDRCNCGNKLKHVENYNEIPFDLLKEEKEEIVKIDDKLRNFMTFEGILLLTFGFIWSLTIVFGTYSYFIAIPSIILGIIVILFSLNETYHNKYLMPVYLSAAIIALSGFIMCVLVTLYAFIDFNPAFFKSGGDLLTVSFPPIVQPLAMGLLSCFISFWMFATGLRKM